MNHTKWATLVIAALVLAVAGCAPAAAPTPVPAIVLEPTGSVQASNVQASAEVLPAREARLSFVIPGPIKEVTVEEGQGVEAGQVLAILSSPELEYGLLQAESAVRVAELDYEYWKLPRRVGREVVERGPLAEQELEVARRSLDTSRAELIQTELVAPFAATVVSVEAQPGEFVKPGQVVIVLAELDDLNVETIDLSEENIATVEIGQPATVYVDALDREFQGVVTAISPISDTIGGDVVFTVTVELEEQPDDLLWGMSANVEIQTEP